MYLNSVEGVGPRNVVQSKCSVRAFWLDFLPVCQHMFLHTSAHPVRADRICHQHAHVRYTDRAWMAGKHLETIFLPGIVVLLLTVYKVFSPVKDTWCTVVMLSLVFWSVSVYARSGGVALNGDLQEGGTFTFSAIRLKLAFLRFNAPF